MNENAGISGPKILGIFVLALLALTGLGWLSDANDLMKYKFFGPRQEAVRREVYEQTKSYKTGSIQRLSTLCTQVDAAGAGQKSMINDVIAHEFVEWNATDVPVHLRDCLSAARSK